MNSLPSKIDWYEIIRFIDASNAAVYEAFDPRFNRKVAIKELSSQIERLKHEPSGSDAVAHVLARFEREQKAVGCLDHPNIMRVFDAGRFNNAPYLVMELLEGEGLHKFLNRRGVLSFSEAAPLLEQILAALAHAHMNGIIHRDLKPANIQVLPDGQVKLMDFGIAHLQFESSLTQTGHFIGTAGFAAPEQLLGQPIDTRTDLFSVGAIAYVMMIGQLPFAGNTLTAIGLATLSNEPWLPSHLDRRAVLSLQRALQKQPHQRFQSATEMGLALRGQTASPLYPAVAQGGVNLAVPAKNNALRQASPKINLQRRSNVFTWATAALSTLVMALWVLWSPKPTQDPASYSPVPASHTQGVASTQSTASKSTPVIASKSALNRLGSRTKRSSASAPSGRNSKRSSGATQNGGGSRPPRQRPRAESTQRVQPRSQQDEEIVKPRQWKPDEPPLHRGGDDDGF